MKGNLSRLLAMLVAVFMVGVFCAGVSPVSAEEAPQALRQLDQAFVAVAEKVTPAVVNISSSKKAPSSGMTEEMEPFFKNHPFREFFGDEFFKRFKKAPPGEFRQQGMGSGVIVSEDGTILTNAHVVKDADEIDVKLSDKRSFKAKVIGADPESDIAVIKIDAKGLPTAKLGDSSKLRVGEIVLAVGNPFGLNRTVTSGIISATGRTNVGIIDYEDFIQTDAAINPGNSGGPLVNIYGEVIGINTAIATRSGGYQGIGFAIPISSAKLIMDDLLKTGKVRRGLLGVNIQDVTEALAKSFGRKDSAGALVSQVIPGSPAEHAGVKAGDIILKFDGEDVASAAHLKNLVGRVKPGTKASLTIFRDNKIQNLDVQVGEKTPQSFASLEKPGEQETATELGLELEAVPSAAASKLGLKAGEGLRVKDIKSDGVGSRIGIREGDIILEVNGKSVTGLEEFKKAISEAKKENLVRFKIQRGTAKLFLAGNIS
ncbi:MAG: DegQ family serine endoprotease [Thermodesulfobacteriota bacterium]